MRLYIDECLSPGLATRLGQRGHDTIHPLHVGRCGHRDHTVKDYCIAEDRVIVTENVADFKSLLAREPVHPGLIALPQTTPTRDLNMILAAIALLETLAENPMDAIVNHCVDFDEFDGPVLRALASPG